MTNVVETVYIDSAELEGFVRQHRELLAKCHGASTPVRCALRAAGMTPFRLHVLAARSARDPSWNCGFLNPCLIVVRPDGHARGRLGFWVEDGILCMEMQGDHGLVISRGPTGGLSLTRAWMM